MINSNNNQNMDSWKSGNRYDDSQSTDVQKKSVVVSFKAYKDDLRDKYLHVELSHQQAEAHKTELANLKRH